MRSLIAISIFALVLASCRTNQDSTVKDSVAIGPGGRAILFKKAGNGVLIKECVDYPEDLLVRKDCDKRSGTIEAHPSTEEFRSHLKAALKVSPESYTEEMQQKIGRYNKGEVAGIAGLQDQRRGILRKLESVKDFVRNVKGDNPENAKSPEDRQEISRLEGDLADVEGKLQNNSDLIGPVREINELISKLVDDIILDPAKFEVFLSSDTRPENHFFFNLLSSYVKLPALEWEFVELSHVNGTGFPAQFEMGSISEGSEKPIHTVKLTRPFAVQTTEVTQSQWFEIMGSNPSRFQNDFDCEDEHDATKGICPNRPVENVSWDLVQVFIGTLNSKLGLDCGATSTRRGFVKASQTPGCYRLPTEAEWEYFARAGTTTRYNLGEFIFPDKINYLGNWPEHVVDYKGPKEFDRSGSVAVRSLDNANPWGLFDTHGNVWEWAQDRYGSHYYGISPQDDPMGPENGRSRVKRGGSWADGYSVLRSSFRGKNWPGSTYSTVGFRLVRTSAH